MYFEGITDNKGKIIYKEKFMDNYIKFRIIIQMEQFFKFYLMLKYYINLNNLKIEYII